MLQIFDKADLPVADWFQTKKREPVYPKVDRMYLSRDRLFCKETDVKPEDVEFLMRRIEAGSRSPCSTPLLGWIYEGTMFRGWVCPFIPDLKLSTYQNHPEVFRWHALHQRALVLAGYVDVDPGLPNWMKKKNGKYATFDRDAVYPLEFVWRINCFRRDAPYFQMLDKSFRIPPKIQDAISFHMTRGNRRDALYLWDKLSKGLEP